MHNNSYDKGVLKEFCSKMSWTILEFPDESNRKTKDVDCLAIKDGIRYCIEHTSYDTLKNQRQKNDYFLKSIKGIEERYRNLNYRLNICIEWDAIKKKGDAKSFSKINSSIQKWIKDESPFIEACTSYPLKIHKIQNYDGLTIDFSISKQIGNLNKGVFITRGINNKNKKEFEESFLNKNKMDEQLKRKIKKLNLNKYHDCKKILILESNDIALMNKTRIEKAVVNYFSQSQLNVNQIWYCDTSIKPSSFYKIYSSD